MRDAFLTVRDRLHQPWEKLWTLDSEARLELLESLVEFRTAAGDRSAQIAVVEGLPNRIDAPKTILVSALDVLNYLAVQWSRDPIGPDEVVAALEASELTLPPEQENEGRLFLRQLIERIKDLEAR